MQIVYSSKARIPACREAFWSLFWKGAKTTYRRSSMRPTVGR
ncbi:hypothetical protein HMPREF1556_00254, partial [Porphyromonas sp. oral taxon 278 str. W7784]